METKNIKSVKITDLFTKNKTLSYNNPNYKQH